VESARRATVALRALFLRAVIFLILVVSAVSPAAAALAFSNDVSHLYYSLTYTGTPTFFRVFLDTDQNASTGYPIGGIGADYLIENSILYSYSGTAGGWGWRYVKSIPYSNASNVADWVVASADLGNPLVIYLIGGADSLFTAILTQTSTTPTPPPAGLNLLTGSYSGCTNGVGSGCAKGDYRSGSDATVSTNSSTLTTPTGNFTSADVGKRGVAVDWSAPNFTGGTCSVPGQSSGYGCYAGVSCPFTVSTVNSSTSINVTLGSGCGGSGIGFNSSANAYWAVYTNDTMALGNALAAATTAGQPLYVPANYKGGIASSADLFSGVMLQCASGAIFYNPNLTTTGTSIMRFLGGSNYTITGCTFSGTEPTSGAWADLRRQVDMSVVVEGGATNVSINNSTFKNFWGITLDFSSATNAVVSNNTFQNCGQGEGVQFAETGGTSSASNNTFVDCNWDSEDGAPEAPSVDSYQTIQSNTLIAVNGTGYYRTQTALGLDSQGSVFLACGSACSGGTCNSNQYTGVTCSGDTVSGTNSVIQTSNQHGATVTGNTCNGGCSYK